MSEAVVFEQVSRRFGSFAAVDAVSFSVEAGTLVTLLGPSGCGKTTTLRLIAGLEQASAGRILIGGVDVTLRSPAERDVAMVFQSYALFPHMNVMENVCYGLRAGGMARGPAEAAAADKLRLVGLSGLERRLPSELSGGQQQRVAVARAIVLEPKVLLFDEPLSNLDAKLRRRVREEIRTLQRELGLTVVYVTHDQQEALAVSDRVIVMNAGRIAQDGAPSDLYERPASRFIADFIGDANLVPATIEAGVLRVGSGHVALGLPGAGNATLAIRPHALLLGHGPLSGFIVRATYLGSHMEYGVRLEGLDEELFVTGPVAGALAPGAAVAVDLDPAGVAVVPAA
jgi:iron(III) transport system ATP-binding protein